MRPLPAPETSSGELVGAVAPASLASEGAGLEPPQQMRRVCDLADLPPGAVLRVEGPEPIAVFNVAGEIFAVGDTCTHEDASLSEGWVDGAVVECPYHLARFCLRTGRALCLPATKPLPVYQVVARDGAVWVGR
jgi:3-phenylpropionate/trans-cinnamate dioxygenase ferredoxin subunit